MDISKLIIFTALVAASKSHRITSEGIVGDALTKMCVGMWDGAKGLIDFFERLSICSRVLTMTR